jgi:secreted trypsin-like serine protease
MMRRVGWFAVLVLAVSASAGAAQVPKPSAHAAIVGGVPLGTGAFPSAAFVLFQGNGGTFTCSGTVVSPHVVLTAGHCAVDANGQPEPATGYVVGTGGVDISSPSSFQHLSVAQVVPDPSYDPSTHRDDVAALVLAQPTSAPPIALPGGAEDALLTVGSKYGIAGWGEVADGADTMVLHAASTQLASQTACSAGSGGAFAFDPATQVCTLDPGDTVSTCEGDSGGPLYVFGGPEIGVVSSGPWNCDPAGTDQFTRIDVLMPWLAPEIAAADPGYSLASGGVAAPAAPPAPSFAGLSIATGRRFINRQLAGIAHYTPGSRDGFRETCIHVGAHQHVQCTVSWTRGKQRWSGALVLINTPTTDGDYGLTYIVHRRTSGCRPASSSRCTKVFQQ